MAGRSFTWKTVEAPETFMAAKYSCYLGPNPSHLLEMPSFSLTLIAGRTIVISPSFHRRQYANQPACASQHRRVHRILFA